MKPVAMPEPSEMQAVTAPLAGAVISSAQRLAEKAMSFESPAIKEEFVQKGKTILENILKTEEGITDIQLRTDRVIRVQRGAEMAIFSGHGKTPIREVLGIALALYRSKSGIRDRNSDSHEEEDREFVRRLVADKRVNFAAEGGGVISSVISEGRMRVHAFFDMTGVSISVRVLNDTILPLEKLGFNESVADQLRALVKMRSGLGIVTGQTGSGKSTTLAALIDYLRTATKCHIVTVEEPVEYRFPDTTDAKGEQYVALVTQREVGIQVASFEDGLVDALRQHPNVIMIGEIRDTSTMQTCLAAALTGHSVLATLHTNGATETVSRILEFFNPEKQAAILSQLASALNFVLTQGLFASQKKPGAYSMVYELFVNRATSSRSSIRKFLENKSSIESEMSAAPNVKWDDCIEAKRIAGEITQEDADANRRREKTDEHAKG